jgi:phage terminase large subunit-like protein
MQPLYFLITTAGDNTNSICWEVHSKAKDILDGRKTDPTFYPVIYGTEENDSWTDPKVWKKANPSLGITVGVDKVKAACESAQQNPAKRTRFEQLQVEPVGQKAIRWMRWICGINARFRLTPKRSKGVSAMAVLTFRSSTDITAFVSCFPPLDEDEDYILPFFWIPRRTRPARAARSCEYDLWQKQCFLLTTEVTCTLRVHRDVHRTARKEYNIRENRV